MASEDPIRVGRLMGEHHVLDEIGTKIPDSLMGDMSLHQLVAELLRVRTEVICKRVPELAISWR